MDKLRCGFLTNFLVKKSTPEPSLENIYKTIKAMNQFFEKQKDASLYQNGFMLDGVFYDGTYCAPIFKCFKRLKILDKTGAITNNTFKTFYETLTDENLQKKLTDFKDMSSNQTVYSNNGFIVNGQPITRDALTPFFKILSKLGIATRSSGDLRSCLLGRAKVYSLEMSKFSQFHTNPSDVSSPPKIGGVKCTLPDSLPPRPQTKLPPINREFYNQFLVQARGQYDALLTTLMPNKELMERIQSLEFERPLSNEFQIFDQVLSELMKPYQERQPIHYFKYNDLDNTDMNGDLTPRFTVPSIKHQNDNQDRVEVVKLGCDTVIILSDGVSECSNQFSEKGSGKDMAIHLTTTFKDYCESNKFKNKLQELKQGLQGNMYNSKEFLTHISKFKRQMVGEIVVSTRVAFSNEGDQSKQTNLGAATFTLSLALDLGQAGRYLLSMFYGDSQTILRKQDGRIIQLNPFLLANNQSKPDKIFLENDLEQVADFKRFSDPGQTVDYDNVNNPKLLPYVSIVPINAGDQYVVCSDGVGDGISTLDEDKQSAKLNKDLFGDILMFCKQNGMMDKEIAAFIACLSLKLSPKQDDIALAVHSVGALDLLGISRDSNQCYAISAVQFLRHMPMGKFGSVFNYLSYLKTNMDNDKLTYQGENFSFDSQAKNSRLRKNTIDFWLKLLDPDLRKTTPNQKLGFIKDILLYFPAFGRGQNCPGEFLNCAFFNLFTISYTPDIRDEIYLQFGFTIQEVTINLKDNPQIFSKKTEPLMLRAPDTLGGVDELETLGINERLKCFGEKTSYEGIEFENLEQNKTTTYKSLSGNQNYFCKVIQGSNGLYNLQHFEIKLETLEFAVVFSSGLSSTQQSSSNNFSGHYTCIKRISYNQFLLMDDALVSYVDLNFIEKYIENRFICLAING